MNKYESTLESIIRYEVIHTIDNEDEQLELEDIIKKLFFGWSNEDCKGFANFLIAKGYKKVNKVRVL